MRFVFKVAQQELLPDLHMTADARQARLRAINAHVALFMAHRFSSRIAIVLDTFGDALYHANARGRPDDVVREDGTGCRLPGARIEPDGGRLRGPQIA
jgi:hypothetical protein